MQFSSWSGSSSFRINSSVNRRYKMALTRHFLILALTFLALGTITRAQDDDVMKVDSSIVVMNATIRDTQNRPVSGLRQLDFQIFEDGIQQKITSFETQE